MDVRSQLEVRALFTKFLGKISKKDNKILIKILENAINDFRHKKGDPKPDDVDDDPDRMRSIKDLFDNFIKQFESREYFKLISVIEFEIMNPSNIYGLLKETTPVGDDDDSDIQIIEIIKPAVSQSPIANVSVKSDSKIKADTNNQTQDSSIVSNQPTSKIISVKPDGKKPLNRILFLEQIAAKQTRASKLKVSKGQFKKIQYKDFVDYGTNKLIDSKLKSLDCHSNSITLNANIIGVSKSQDGMERFLIEWIPENYADNEWVDRNSFQETKIIDMCRANIDKKDINSSGFYRPLRYRSVKRK